MADSGQWRGEQNGRHRAPRDATSLAVLHTRRMVQTESLSSSPSTLQRRSWGSVSNERLQWAAASMAASTCCSKSGRNTSKASSLEPCQPAVTRSAAADGSDISDAKWAFVARTLRRSGFSIAFSRYLRMRTRCAVLTVVARSTRHCCAPVIEVLCSATRQNLRVVNWL